MRLPILFLALSTIALAEDKPQAPTIPAEHRADYEQARADVEEVSRAMADLTSQYLQQYERAKAQQAAEIARRDAAMAVMQKDCGDKHVPFPAAHGKPMICNPKDAK